MRILDSGKAKAPPPPPPPLEPTAKKVVNVIGESEKLLKQPVTDVPPDPAINEIATTAAPPPPEPSAAATGSGMTQIIGTLRKALRLFPPRAIAGAFGASHVLALGICIYYITHITTYYGYY